MLMNEMLMESRKKNGIPKPSMRCNLTVLASLTNFGMPCLGIYQASFRVPMMPIVSISPQGAASVRPVLEARFFSDYCSRRASKIQARGDHASAAVPGRDKRGHVRCSSIYLKKPTLKVSGGSLVRSAGASEPF